MTESVPLHTLSLPPRSLRLYSLYQLYLYHSLVGKIKWEPAREGSVQYLIQSKALLYFQGAQRGMRIL